MRRWITHEFADDERREQFLAQVIVWFDQTQVGLNRCGLYPIGGKRGTSYTVAAWARGDNAAAVGLDVLVCFAQDVDGYGWGDFTYAAYASWAAVCGRDQAMARALIHRECDPREITMTRIHNLPFVSDALRRASPELQRKWAAPSKK